MLSITPILLAIGLLAGLLAGLLGIGGGLVIVPALTALFVLQGMALDTAAPLAVATSLGTMLLTTIGAVWFHHGRAAIDWRGARRLGIAVAIGAAGGAWLASSVPGDLLARVFAVIAAAIGLRMAFYPGRPAVEPRPPWPRGWPLMGPAIGGISAMIGIGGGTFNVPYLARNGYPMVQAVAMATVCAWPIALAGAAMFALLPPEAAPDRWTVGYLWLPGVVTIGLGGMLAAPLGAAMAHRLPAARLRRLFGVMLIFVALRMAW